jgi:NTP pyrophosphatase (non-canonical NTP hydrolase)
MFEIQPLTADAYQAAVQRTLINKAPEVTGDEMMVLWNAIGAAGECGELLNLLKKAILHQHGLDEKARRHAIEELGDCLWYLTALATKLGTTLEGAMRINILKLERRYPNGWSYDDSKNHKDGVTDEGI